jgi:hypothetical protein
VITGGSVDGVRGSQWGYDLCSMLRAPRVGGWARGRGHRSSISVRRGAPENEGLGEVRLVGPKPRRAGLFGPGRGEYIHVSPQVLPTEQTVQQERATGVR